MIFVRQRAIELFDRRTVPFVQLVVHHRQAGIRGKRLEDISRIVFRPVIGDHDLPIVLLAEFEQIG